MLSHNDKDSVGKTQIDDEFPYHEPDNIFFIMRPEKLWDIDHRDDDTDTYEDSSYIHHLFYQEPYKEKNDKFSDKFSDKEWCHIAWFAIFHILLWEIQSFGIDFTKQRTKPDYTSYLWKYGSDKSSYEKWSTNQHGFESDDIKDDFIISDTETKYKWICILICNKKRPA